MTQHPKPYLILVQDQPFSAWSFIAAYETLCTAELHTQDLLMSGEYHGRDIKIVKDLGLQVKVSDNTTDKIV